VTIRDYSSSPAQFPHRCDRRFCKPSPRRSRRVARSDPAPSTASGPSCRNDSPSNCQPWPSANRNAMGRQNEAGGPLRAGGQTVRLPPALSRKLLKRRVVTTSLYFRRCPWFGAVHAGFANPPIGHFQSLPETAIIASFKGGARCIPARQKSPALVFGLDRAAG
jgi:hypothetical protein